LSRACRNEEPHFVALAARHHCERLLSPGSDRRGFFVATGLIALKRAGADSVLAYFPIRIAEKLKKGGV
jgi:hypothetical protein